MKHIRFAVRVENKISSRVRNHLAIMQDESIKDGAHRFNLVDTETRGIRLLISFCIREGEVVVKVTKTPKPLRTTEVFNIVAVVLKDMVSRGDCEPTTFYAVWKPCIHTHYYFKSNFYEKCMVENEVAFRLKIF